ncbi:MAG: hypothetical protein M0Z59_07640 [Nitrospiraceae bacterium]|nr:hypothetical protein [Nitrospiraceae bacterium]
MILTFVLAVIFVLTRALAGMANSSPSYFMMIVSLLLGMLIILGGCELFANGVEHLGDRLNLSHATVGSLLAAVGTALPETIVPVLALLFGKAQHREGIAVGAILGAPFMLSTLAMFLLGITVLVRKLMKKSPRAELGANMKALWFELKFILLTMAVVLAASLLHKSLFNHIGAAVLLISYALFFYYSLRHEAEEGEQFAENFHFGAFLGYPKRAVWIGLQVVVGLAFIVAGAFLFVDYISLLSVRSGVSPLVLSLLIVPFATELPEKFNSISWTLKGKDTLALANITGAVVFQSTIPVSIGLLFTDWSIGGIELLNIFSVILMTALIAVVVSLKNKIPAWLLLSGGLFYFLYIVFGLVVNHPA